MKTSRSSRLAKRCALLFVPAIPFVLGANEDGWSGSEELPPIPRPYASSWQIGCKNVQFETNATEIADFDSTSWCTVSEFARPKYHANADPRCTVGNKGPAFYVADGKLYSRDFSRSHDLAPLFGGRTPNAPSAPIVTIPGTTLVYVFFGYAPQADTEESPRAFFMVFDAEKFRDDPSQTWIQGLFPLDIGSNENAGCGTIHLATVASDAEHPNHATVFVSTCRHAYGFHIAPPADGFSRERFFREEISADRAKQNTHHRAEMEVLAMNGGYAVFWPFERNNGKPAIAVTRLPQDGVPTHKTLTLDFGIDLGTTAIPFIKGLEIARDWRSLYVTWPGAPDSLFQFKLFEPDGTWSATTPPKVFQGFNGGDDIGYSQLQTGADDVLYVLQDSRLVSAPNTMTPGYFDDGNGIGYTSYADDWPQDPIRFLPPVTRGATNGCTPRPAPESGGTGGSGMGGAGGVSESSGTMSSSGMGGAGGVPNYGFCSDCTNYYNNKGAYWHECNELRKACEEDTECEVLFRWAYPYTTTDGAGACALKNYLKNYNFPPTAVEKYSALDQCVTCRVCRNSCEPLSTQYCSTLADPDACNP